MKSVLVLLLILMPCVGRTADLDRFCFPMGGARESVCYVSISMLVSRGEEFNGRTVIVQGYFAYSGISMIFSSIDDFLSSNTANGLMVSMPDSDTLLNKLYGLNHRMVMVKAKFSAVPVDLMGNQGYRASGRLYDLMQVSDSFMPWGYTEHEPPPYPRKKADRRPGS